MNALVRKQGLFLKNPFFFFGQKMLFEIWFFEFYTRIGKYFLEKAEIPAIIP
jgi:hypothetical protein